MASPVTSTPNYIEFRCPQCQKLLRITTAAAGKQAQCPECRATMVVPAPAVSPPQPIAPQPPAIDGSVSAADGSGIFPSTRPTPPTLVPSWSPPPQSDQHGSAAADATLQTPATPGPMSATKALFDRITA